MSDTFQDSIDHVRASADVLSDPADFDDLGVLDWMKHHVAFTRHKHRYIIGTEPLPPAWRRETLKITASQDALTLLRPLKTDHTAMAGLRRALQAVSPVLAPTDETVITSLAEALATQKAWIIRDARKPHQPAVKTDPAVYAALNAEGGTNVDFAYLSRWEGNQALRGYVPFSHGKVAGRSGMTVATGFDIGQIDANELKKLNLPDSLVAKVMPFLAPPFTGMTRAEVAASIAKKAPVPVLTKAESDAADLAVHGKHLNAAILSWNGRRGKNVPEFNALPQAWQTVLFSRTFHQGIGMPNAAVSQPFYEAATAGKWAQAADALQAYHPVPAWYKLRVTQEAALLRTAFPPAVTPPPTTAPGQK